MKKLILFLFFIPAVLFGQVPSDTGALNLQIRTDIVTNGSKQISAAKLNNILLGITKLMKAYAIDSSYRIEDTLFLVRRGGFTTLKVRLNTGGVSSETDPSVNAAAKTITNTDKIFWNGKQNTLTTSAEVSIIADVITVKKDSAYWNANKIRGNPVSIVTPTNGQVLKWNGTAWAPASDSIGAGGSGGYTPPGDNTKLLDGTGAAIAPTKSLVGLGSVDNTPDNAKPVSTAQATAIALKYDIANVTTRTARDSSNSNVATTRYTDKAIQTLRDSVTRMKALIKANARDFTVTGTDTINQKRGSWYTAADVDTIVIDLINGPTQKIILSVNRAIKIINARQSEILDLEITHSVAGTTITNLPAKLPWDFYWATGTGEVTFLTGVYDSANAKWNWRFGIQDAAFVPIYTTHVMLAFTDFARPKLKTWYAGLRAAGYNAVWLHDDGYDTPTNVSRLRESLDSSYAAGLRSIIGISIQETAVEAANVITDSWNHPGLQWYRGRRLIFSYDFDSAKLSGMIDTLTNRGYARSKYWLVASTVYPTFTGSAWTYRTGGPADSATVAHLYNHFTFLDGVLDFSVDKGSSNPSVVTHVIRDENTNIVKASRAQNKISAAGISTIYHNPAVQLWNIGYDGTDTLYKAMLANKPDILLDNTANDQFEWSYNTINSWTPVVAGSSYLPDTATHSSYGANIFSYPQLDHSGLQKFGNPYIDAFLNNRSSIATITQDKIFIDYTLHPKNASAYTTIPAELANNAGYNGVGFWAGTPYASVPSWASDATKFPKFNTIKVAAHLMTPAQIKINGGTPSSTIGPGIVFFEQAQALGTITVEIIRGGLTVASGTSSKPITNNRWPGGGNAIFEQIY